MTLIMLDGCEDLYSWRNSTNTGVGGGTIVPGRNGNCIQLTPFTNGYFWIPPAQQSDTITVGCAFRQTALADSTGNFLQFMSDNTGSIHCQIRVMANGSIRVQRGGSTIATSVTGLILPVTWYYIEVQFKLHDTTGFVKVRVNGTEVINSTNVDTKAGGTMTTVETIVTDGGSPAYFHDDFYIMSGSGDSFLGDITVETLYPNGNGNANQWIGSDANSVDNYVHVDEAGVPITTDYVASSTSGHQDMYTMGDLVTVSGTVKAVCHVAYAGKTDAANTRQLKLVNRRASDTKSGAIDLATLYTNHHYALELDPETGAAWTIANVNSLQSGVEIV